MGAAGVMERGGVAAAGLMKVAVFFLQAEAGEVRDGIDGEVESTGAVQRLVAEGKKGSALTFRDGRAVGVAANGSGPDKAEGGVRADAFSMAEAASVGLDFFKAAPAAASEAVLVTGVVV